MGLLETNRRILGSQRGSMLLETVITMLIMTVVGLSLISLIQKGTIASFKAREQATCTRMVQTGFARVKNIDFYFLFGADSAQTYPGAYGLQAAYPYKAALDGLKTTLSASRFDRFKVSITHMRRDTSDANANGLSSDLMAFTDSNGNQIDDYDPNIRYLDQNADGDTYDTYASGGRTVAEQPDTHIKQVTLDVYRLGRLVCSRTELVSLEQFSGDTNPSSEAVLSLLVSTPTNSAFLYRAVSPSEINARGLALVKAYPSEVAQIRADTGSSLPVSGETDSLATVNLYVGTSGILDTTVADFNGVFSAAAANVTAALIEGNNLFSAQAVKDAYTSPITQRTLLLDFNAPKTSNTTPSGTVGTLAPYAAVNVYDLGIGTATVSGICPDVITLKINGVVVSHNYDPATGVVVWIDSMTNTVPVVSSAPYTAIIEAGDYAGYRTTHSWSFTLSLPVPNTDNSAPSVSNKSPIGAAASALPTISVKISDNQTGINPLSISMKVDGVVVVSSANISGAYNPASEVVSYTPSGAFISGSSHAVEIRASHFGTDPADKIESVDTWNFSVP